MAGTAVMERLLSVDWYRGYIQGRQYVMIGLLRLRQGCGHDGRRLGPVRRHGIPGGAG